jgi:hypothetical protein
MGTQAVDTTSTTTLAATGESLPFSGPKQEALMGYLLTDERFFMIAKHRILPEWWSIGRLQQIWGISIRFSNRYGRAPKATEIIECQEMMAMDLAEANRLKSVINLSIQRRMDFGLDMLQAELTDWFKCRIYVAAMKKSESLFNLAAKGGQDSKKLQEAFDILKRMSKEIEDASFEAGQVEDMSNPVQDFQNQLVEAKDAISFGLPLLDEILLPEGEGRGSLLKGDMTVLLAPTNIGKTTTMVTIAALNVWAGKDVLLITHEGRVGDIKLKIWQSMMGLSRKEVMGRLNDDEFRKSLDVIRTLVNKHLEFMPLNKAGLTVEEVEAAIRRRNDRWRGSCLGKGFDLIIDDYAAKLTTSLARGGQFQLRQIHEVVYNYFSQIALQEGCHVITAIQTNREGSKTNKKIGKDVLSRLLTLEDVMESWGPMTTATNVISINRDPSAQAKGIVTFFICKSRSSEVGWAVACKSNYAAAQSHQPESPATKYRGTSPMSEKIDSLLEGYCGREIPWEEVGKIENGS